MRSTRSAMLLPESLGPVREPCPVSAAPVKDGPVIRLPVAPERIAHRVELTRAEQHYLLDVLRLGADATLEVFDGIGGCYPARLVSSDAVELGERRDEVAGSRAIVLAQALAKGEKVDFVVQKATELGATAIAPFEATRSVVRLDAARAGDRVRRWQRIASEAARQCGRADVPPVWSVGTLASILERARAEQMKPLVLFEQERARRFSEALAEPGPVMIVVGPEGGFTAEEIATSQHRGGAAVSLGRRVLRTETAGLAALVIARFIEGDLG